MLSSFFSSAVFAIIASAEVVKCPIGIGPDFGLHYSEHNPVVIDLKIGSQQSPVQVGLDSGSFDLWVPLPGASGHLPYYGTYDPKKSNTSVDMHNRKHIWYGKKRSIGDIDFYSDYISIGGVTLNTTFGVANASNVHFPILGLGGPTQDKYPTIFSKMKEDGIINSTSFSLYLADDYTGEILFGGIDDAKYEGNLTTVKNLNFGFHSPKYTIGNTTYGYNGKVVVDSGWNVGFGFPNKLGDHIKALWNDNASKDMCEGPDDLFFEIFANEGSIKIYVKELLRKRPDGICYLDLANTGSIVIGLKGYQHVYISSNFDAGTLSFAKKVNTNDTKIREL